MDARVLTEVLIGNKIVNLDSRVTALTTSAKVQLFPDPNTGIRITDGTNDVFKCITGGTDVGDVILGSATGQYVKWDKSAGKLIVNGELAADTLTGTELKATANLTVGSSNDVIRLSGDDSTYRIWAGHATASSAPFRVTKGGALTATAANLKTATGDQRIEMATTGSGESASSYISLYVGGVLNAKMGQIDVGDDSLGYFVAAAADALGYGGTYNVQILGWWIDAGADGSIVLPTYSSKQVAPGSFSSRGCISWDPTNNKLKVQEGSTTYTFSPD